MLINDIVSFEQLSPELSFFEQLLVKITRGFVCLCWGFMAQSIQWGHVERGQFT